MPKQKNFNYNKYAYKTIYYIPRDANNPRAQGVFDVVLLSLMNLK